MASGGAHYRGTKGIYFNPNNAAEQYRKKAEQEHANKLARIEQWKQANPKHTKDQLLAFIMDIS